MRELIAYSVGDTSGWELLPAPAKRRWMQQTPAGFASRCLPLTIANQAGWILTCPVSFTARWNGDERPSNSIVFSFDDEASRHGRHIQSHFGSGIVTFSVPFLFRTPPRIGLLVRGVPNESKENCSPLEGFVETNWTCATFTMNWKIHRPRIAVRFARGEPICFLQPYDLRLIEELQPIVRPLEASPRMAASYEAWQRSRDAFNASPDRGVSWQKHYHRGHDVTGRRARAHRTSLRLSRFASD